MLIEGAISVKSAINNHKRTIEKIFINVNKKTKDYNYIRKICKINNIVVEECNEEVIKNISTGKTNGGICAEVGNRINDEFVDGDIFYLDGIEDPFNLGYAMRTLYAFGVKNVLLSKRDYSLLESQILKSSAGAFDMLNIKISSNELLEIKDFKNKGYYIYGLYRNDESKDIFDIKFNNKALFMLGGEKRGISNELLSVCDEHLYISYGSDFRNSLNACGALDVVATLLYSQRRK